MENPIKMDDLGKTHYFRKHPNMAFQPPLFQRRVMFRYAVINRLTLQVSDFGLDTQLLEARQALQLLHLNELVIGLFN